MLYQSILRGTLEFLSGGTRLEAWPSRNMKRAFSVPTAVPRNTGTPDWAPQIFSTHGFHPTNGGLKVTPSYCAQLSKIYSEDDTDKNIGFCPDSGCYLFQKKRTVEAINNLRVHIQKRCLSELDEGGTAITPHPTRFHIGNPMDSSKSDSA